MSDKTKSTFAPRVRAMPVLSMMMRMAELWGYRVHNPYKNAKRYRMEPKERFLTVEEMVRLNAVIDAIPRYGPDCSYLFPARRRGPSTTSPRNGTASATRLDCPGCGFTTFATPWHPLPP